MIDLVAVLSGSLGYIVHILLLQQWLATTGLNYLSSIRISVYAHIRRAQLRYGFFIQYRLTFRLYKSHFCYVFLREGLESVHHKI